MRIEKLDLAIGIVAISMGVYHLANCYFYIFPSINYRMIHLAFAMTLVFLPAIKQTKKPLLMKLLLLIVLGIFAYYWVNLERMQIEVGLPLDRDIIVGSLLILITFGACWLSFGPALPLVGVILIFYAFLCHYIGGPYISVSEIVTAISLSFDGFSLWGKMLTISVNIIFLFVLYGGLLQGKATDFFVQLGSIMGRYVRSGPAMAAVISSGLMGMTTGQATPNIAVTGAFSIPLMKKVGYKPELAAAIEAAASGGSQIMPPIMGAGAFVMAEMLGVPYSRVIVMAAIPALLYYFAIGVFVYLHAIKAKVAPLEMKVNKKDLVVSAPLFMVPLLVILALLFLEYPPMLSAFWGITSLIAVSFVRKETRPSLDRIMTGCIHGATVGAKIAVACATLGPIISMMTKSGLALQIGYSVESWSGGNVFFGLIIMTGAIILLGMEVPTVAAYLIASVVAIPGLVKLGLPVAPVHMFAFYFAAFSGLTPPIGMAALVASKLADASYIKTAFLSVEAAAVAFVIPFIFVFNDTILLLPGVKLFSLLVLIPILLGIFILEMAFVGFFLNRLNVLERTLAAVCGSGFLIFASVNNLTALFISSILLVCLFLLIFRENILAIGFLKFRKGLMNSKKSE